MEHPKFVLDEPAYPVYRVEREPWLESPLRPPPVAEHEVKHRRPSAVSVFPSVKWSEEDVLEGNERGGAPRADRSAAAGDAEQPQVWVKGSAKGAAADAPTPRGGARESVFEQLPR